jgi:hypothetical protein
LVILTRDRSYGHIGVHGGGVRAVPISADWGGTW